MCGMRSFEKEKRRMRRWLRVELLLLWAAMGLLCHCAQGGGDSARQIRLTRVRFDGEHRRSNAAEVASSADRGRWIFVEAQRAQRRQDFARANELYEEAFVLSSNASTFAHKRLRMWVQFLHADLLMHRLAPQVELEQGQAAGNALKRRAIRKFEDAVQLSEFYGRDESLQGSGFGMDERVHALNSMGLLAMDLGNYYQAHEHFLEADRVARGTASAPIANSVLPLVKLGRFYDALASGKRAYAITPNDSHVLHNLGMVYDYLGEEHLAESFWRRALVSNPNAQSLVSIAMVVATRGETTEARELLEKADNVVEAGPMQASVQLQRAVSHLDMVYESTQHLLNARRRFEDGIGAIFDRATKTQGYSLPDVMTTVGGGSMGYYAVYQGYNDRLVRMQLYDIYRIGAASELTFIAPHVSTLRNKRLRFVTFGNGYDTTLPPDEQSIIQVRRRIRVGFHSAFLRHHSVGLLISGVIRHLSRSDFEVIVLTYAPPPNDYLFREVQKSADRVILLPPFDIHQAQRLAASLELDILVFSELGMHPASYFLSFSQLALRTVAFWGHAVTSGIGTVDYFVSSRLFRDNGRDTSYQERYSECLYEMDGLTTLFPRPPAPLGGISRDFFQLPSKRVMPYMILVPQTLYKLHPDFDSIVQQILSHVRTSFLVLPVGDKPALVDQLTRRWRRGSVMSDDVYRRIFFIRKMNQTEYLSLCEMSDLVLDTFPVGGGRSSMEIFSVGTPIVGLVPRTTVLQLTLGMYRRMGISCCMFENEKSLVKEAVALLNDDQKRHQLRMRILQNNYKLYEAANQPVVKEWEVFFRFTLGHPPPAQSASHSSPRQCPVDEKIEQNYAPKLLYEAPVHVEDQQAQQTQPRLASLRLYEGDDPFIVAWRYTDDVLQASFLGKILWNIQQNFRQRIVDTFTVQSPNATHNQVYHIAICEGDDLHQVVSWQVREQARRASRDVDFITDIAKAVDQAIERVPDHSSIFWRQQRAISPSKSFQTIDKSWRECVALIITTCKRLPLFLRTIASLRTTLNITEESDWHDRFCLLLILDDDSAEFDREAMRAAAPTFEFVWKSVGQKGHARSLNIALHRVQNERIRFLMYVEDDWEFLASERDVLDDALAVLQSTPLAQVLFNDQQSGWASSLFSPTNRLISYSVHEFAVTDPAHKFAYWPGFSLNPGVWDLFKLGRLVDSPKPFREDTDIFEREFSLQVWRVGLEIGFLHGEAACTHIGASPGSNASAYVLNGLPRRFD